MNNFNVYTNQVSFLGATGAYVGKIYVDNGQIMIDGYSPDGMTGPTGADGSYIIFQASESNSVSTGTATMEYYPTSQAQYVTVGSFLYVNNATPSDAGYVLVTAIDTGTNTFTVERILSNINSNIGWISDSTYIILTGPVGPTGADGKTGATGPTGMPPATGNLLHVDTVYGDDTAATASPYIVPFKTVEGAVNKLNTAGLTGQTILIYPGIYEIGSTGITIPEYNSIRGISTQTVTIQKTNVTANTNLMTMGENTRLEDVTLKLTSAGHYSLNGLVFPGNSAVTSKLRTAVVTVDNRNADVTGTSDVNGVLCNGTGTLGPSTFSFNCLKGSTINVYSNGNGKKRGILVNDSNIVTTRDLNVYVAKPTGPTGCTGSYVGIETNDIGGTGSIQLRSTTVGCVKPNTTIGATGELYTASDILQTTPATIVNPTYLASPGIQVGPGTDLVTKSAGGKGFSTYIYPTTIFYGLKGNLSGANTPGYLWPGTLKEEGTYPDVTTPPAFYHIQQPAILSGLFVSLNTAPGTGNTIRITIQRTPAGSATIIPTLFTVDLTGTDTDKSFYNASVDFNTRDKLLVYFERLGGGNSATDLSVQVDMF